MPGAAKLDRETQADAKKPARDDRPATSAGGSRRIGRWFATLLAFVVIAAAGAVWWATQTEAVDPEAGTRIAIASPGTNGAKETPVEPTPVAVETATAANATPEHPLDPALEMAREALERIDREVHDYTARVVMQEQVKGKLLPESECFVKIRHDRKLTEEVALPFSVYLRYDGPPQWKGREAIWVRGWHEGNLVAHETGLLNVMKVYLKPTGDLAMMASRYPIYDIGLRNLIAKLIERGERERKTDPANCVVTEENVELNGRTCRVIRIRHPEKRDDLEFSLAEIFIDEELQLPVRYAGYTWGEKPGEDVLLEQYTYLDVKTNVGLTDEDFMADNEEYGYPGR